MAPASHCEARFWPKQSPPRPSGKIASHERLAMTEGVGHLLETVLQTGRPVKA